MTARTVSEQAAIEALAGHRFPGGHYRIAHWENFLLCSCTGADLLPDGLAHPIALFHLPIAGAGTSIAEMFALGRAESDLSIMLESFAWEFFSPLREEQDYQVSGGIVSARRCRDEGEDEGLYDRIQFRFDVTGTGGEQIARATVTWRYTRGRL